MHDAPGSDAAGSASTMRCLRESERERRAQSIVDLLFAGAQLLETRVLSDVCRALVLDHLARSEETLMRFVHACGGDIQGAAELLLAHCTARADGLGRSPTREAANGPLLHEIVELLRMRDAEGRAVIVLHDVTRLSKALEQFSIEEARTHITLGSSIAFSAPLTSLSNVDVCT